MGIVKNRSGFGIGFIKDMKHEIQSFKVLKQVAKLNRSCLLRVWWDKREPVFTE